MAIDEKTPLTDFDRRFVAEYLIDLKRTEAYRRAGGTAKHANVAAANCYKKPNVRAAIEREIVARNKRALNDADWLLKRLVEEAEADIADLFDPETGALKAVKDWPLIWRKGLIAGVDITQAQRRGTTKPGQYVVEKIKVSDRAKRLEMIGRHIDVQAFKDTVSHEGQVDLVERLQRGRERARSGK